MALELNAEQLIANNDIRYLVFYNNLKDPQGALVHSGDDSSFNGKEAVVLGYFYRCEGGWKFRADGTTSTETSISAIAKGSAKRAIQNH